MKHTQKMILVPEDAWNYLRQMSNFDNAEQHLQKSTTHISEKADPINLITPSPQVIQKQQQKRKISKPKFPKYIIIKNKSISAKISTKGLVRSKNKKEKLIGEGVKDNITKLGVVTKFKPILWPKTIR